MPEGSTAPASGSDGTGSETPPEGATGGTDQTAAGTPAPDAEALSPQDVARLRNEAAALRRRVAAHEKAEEDRRKASLTEQERLSDERAAIERERQQFDTERRTFRLQQAAMLAGGRAGAIYPDVIDAMVLGRMAEVEWTDDGAPTNVDALIGAIRRSHPGLFRAPAGSADGGSGARNSGSGGLSVNDAIRRAAGRQ